MHSELKACIVPDTAFRNRSRAIAPLQELSVAHSVCGTDRWFQGHFVRDAVSRVADAFRFLVMEFSRSSFGQLRSKSKNLAMLMLRIAQEIAAAAAFSSLITFLPSRRHCLRLCGHRRCGDKNHFVPAGAARSDCSCSSRVRISTHNKFCA